MGEKPQSSQQRKKKVLEEVQKHRRRQRTITLAIAAVVLISILTIGVYVLAHQSSSSLPGYLNECVTGNLAYHAHAHLSIVLNNVNQSIPADIGINGACLHPLHTHATDGVIHVEPDQNRTFTIGDFFLIWGQPFNSTQVLSEKFSPGHVVMTVHDTVHPELGNYTIPPNAQAPGNPCSSSSCQDIDIVIAAPV